MEQPQTLTLDQVKALPAVTERVRMKCVECWSAPAAPVGTGVTLAEVFKLAQPTAQATHVRFYATDATVQPGFDRPLDLGGIRPIAGGEQTY